jgi:hypothetical protein
MRSKKPKQKKEIRLVGIIWASIAGKYIDIMTNGGMLLCAPDQVCESLIFGGQRKN